MLEIELKYFEINRTGWLKDHYGKFVLIKGEKFLGAFDNQKDALAEGARRFGMQSFLIKKLEEAEELIYIPALTLGILHADSSYSA